MEAFTLPKDFLLGSATASLQIEGGNRNNSWYTWAEKGNIKDGSHCIVAADHWNRVKEDVHLLKKMNHQTYRMSIEWARIEPEEGEFNTEAMSHYRNEIKQLIKAGIRPMVTLHHFSNPSWLEQMGSWLNEEVIGLFERYTQYVAYHLGDIVNDWVTINEPSAYLICGYVAGIWPPGKKQISSYFKGVKNMILAHILAYEKIHEIRNMMKHSGTQVGAAHHLRIFTPANNKPREKWVIGNLERLTHDIFITGMSEGKLLFPVGTGYPLGKGKYQDFFGINYYTRSMIKFTANPATLFADLQTKDNAPINDLGWEIYPEGLYHLCKKYYKRFEIPIYITENGVCDTRDNLRTKFIYDHLFQVKRLIDEGIDVQRYYHWSTMDNFEWIEGLSVKFGLVEIDYNNHQKRRIRKSGEFYAEICKHNEISDKMIKKYIQR